MKKGPSFCHCEERSDEVIPAGLLRAKIATHLSGARNDKEWRTLNDRVCLMNQATTKIWGQSVQNMTNYTQLQKKLDYYG